MEEFILTFVTYFGICLSTVGLLITMITFILFRYERLLPSPSISVLGFSLQTKATEQLTPVVDHALLGHLHRQLPLRPVQPHQAQSAPSEPDQSLQFPRLSLPLLLSRLVHVDVHHVSHSVHALRSHLQHAHFLLLRQSIADWLDRPAGLSRVRRALRSQSKLHGQGSLLDRQRHPARLNTDPARLDRDHVQPDPVRIHPPEHLPAQRHDCLASEESIALADQCRSLLLRIDG